MTVTGWTVLKTHLDRLAPQYDAAPWDANEWQWYFTVLTKGVDIPDRDCGAIGIAIAQQCEKRPAPAKILEIWRKLGPPKSVPPEQLRFEVNYDLGEEQERVNREGAQKLGDVLRQLVEKQPEEIRAKLMRKVSSNPTLDVTQFEPDAVMLKMARRELIEAGIEEPSDDMVFIRARNLMARSAGRKNR
jgi:hypothetical protein